MPIDQTGGDEFSGYIDDLSVIADFVGYVPESNYDAIFYCDICPENLFCVDVDNHPPG